MDKNLAEVVLDSCEGHPKSDDRLRTIGIEDLVTVADALLDLIEDGKIPDPRGS